MAEPSFHTERHVKYYLRCLKTFLPAPYVSNDSNRMLLAYLTLSGLDVLGVLQSKTTPEERQGYIDWIYHCQVPSGGFRGFSGTDFGAERRTADNEAWDPANIPATFFALVNLLILGDDLTRVQRRACLEWLPRVQRADGSFGEVLGADGKVEGGRDLRYCCCAAGIRYILRGRAGRGVRDVEDIDIPRFISFIEACQVRIVVHFYHPTDFCLLTFQLNRLTTVECPSHLFAKRIVCILPILSKFLSDIVVQVAIHIAQSRL